MRHSWIIVEKEWREIFKNKLVLFTVVLMPLLFTAIPLIMLASMRGAVTGTQAADVPEAFFALCGNVNGGDCIQIYMLSQFLIMFLMIPVMVPVTIGAYSVVGEKTTRSLEPLLATPVTTMELLAGKGLAAVIPAVLATWAGFGLLLALMPLTGASQAIQRFTTQPHWLLGILLIGPLMAILSILVTLMVSSRSNDPRAAQQLASILIVPVMALFFLQIFGKLMLSVPLMLGFAVALVLLSVLALFLAAKVFQREAILTKWR